MMFGKPAMDPKKQALQELMAHLDMKDGKDLGDSMKPKGAAIEVAKIGTTDGDQDGDESPGMHPGSMGDGGDSKMSDDELAELIEALQSKLGA
jgi:hypothetical protein